MRTIPPKRPRLKLHPEVYRELQRQVLERDRWRCQACGTMNKLQVHHLDFRSRCGNDDESNLITLCVDCHRRTHGLR
jgi:5-methylcytosine-specific restriction endonuclease McrA